MKLLQVGNSNSYTDSGGNIMKYLYNLYFMGCINHDKPTKPQAAVSRGLRSGTTPTVMVVAITNSVIYIARMASRLYLRP